jgi:hypothetical protein
VTRFRDRSNRYLTLKNSLKCDEKDLFFVDGEGSSTTLNEVDVSSNTGAGEGGMQILRVINGGTAQLLSSTIENNNPVLVSFCN